MAAAAVAPPTAAATRVGSTSGHHRLALAEPHQVGAQRARALVAGLGLLGQRLHDDGLEPGGHRRVDGAGRRSGSSLTCL